MRCIKVSDYHKECLLCNTEVIDPNRADFSVNTDYPDYCANPTKVSKRANRMLTGFYTKCTTNVIFSNYAFS